jgi:hypothetical protein
VKVDRQVVATCAEAPDQCHVCTEPGRSSRPGRDDDFIEVRVVLDDRQRRGFDHVRKMSVWKPCAERANSRRREHHVANLAKPDKEDS